MLNLLKTPPRGIDVPIQQAQSRLYIDLKNAFGIADNDNDKLEVYGRAYKTQYRDADGIVSYKPMVYAVVADEYKDCLLDDTKWITTFFGIEDRQDFTDAVRPKAPVFLIVHVNLNKINSGTLPHRNDEEVRLEFLEAVRKWGASWQFRELVTGVNNVFSEYSGSVIEKSLYASDMQPYHCFRLNFELEYYPEFIY